MVYDLGEFQHNLMEDFNITHCPGLLPGGKSLNTNLPDIRLQSLEPFLKGLMGSPLSVFNRLLLSKRKYLFCFNVFSIKSVNKLKGMSQAIVLNPTNDPKEIKTGPLVQVEVVVQQRQDLVPLPQPTL